MSGKVITTVIASLIAMFAMMIASPSRANTTLTVRGPGASHFLPCTRAVFATQTDAVNCMSRYASVRSDFAVVTEAASPLYIKEGDNCVAVPSKSLYGRTGPGSSVSGNNVLFSDGPYTDPSYSGGPRKNPYGSSYCREDDRWSIGHVSGNTFAYFYFENSNDPIKDPEEPEDTDKPKPCVLDARWASWGMPKRPVGSTPPHLAKFRVAYVSDAALPAMITDGVSTALPGHFFKVTISEESECTFRRDTRVHIPSDDPNKVGLMVYTLSLWNLSGQAAGPGGGGNEVDEIVVTGRRKISKPIVRYGTPFDASGQAKIADNIARALLQLHGVNCGANCRTTDGQQIPATVVATQEDPSVKFVHPAPQQLARDNPACVQTFDPRCAWNPSPTQPATAQTPPEQLVRMSNDGQTIVHNSTTVYGDTVYPDAMRNAGTAPNSGTPGSPSPPNGSADNPADGSNEDGEGKGLAECAETEGCGKVTSGSVRAYIESVGADPDRDQTPVGVAGGILDRAVKSGSCTSQNAANPYCQMVAGFAMLKAGEGGSGDYVWWEGDIGVGVARRFQQATIPGSLISAVDNIISVLFLVICWNIALRGRA